MGNETRGQSQPAAAKSSIPSSSSVSSIKPSIQPMSIAPKVVAEHLDDGWGEDEPSAPLPQAALAPAKLPQFDEGLREPVKAKAEPALPARVPEGFSKSPSKTPGISPLPRATATKSSPSAASLPAATRGTKDSGISGAGGSKAPTHSIVPITDISNPEASGFELPKVLTVPPKAITPSSRPIGLSNAIPSSVPPPVDESDSDWDVEAPAPSIAPGPSIKHVSAAPAANLSVRTPSSIPPAPISDPAITKPVSIIPIPEEAIRPERRSSPAAGVEEVGQPVATSSNSEAPAALSDAQAPQAAALSDTQAPQKSVVSDAPASNVTSALERYSEKLRKAEAAIPEPQSEDPSRTAAPSDVQAPQAAALPDAQAPQKAVEISTVQTSVSPVVSADSEELGSKPKSKSKWWLFVAAAVLLVGGVWGTAGAKRATLRKMVMAVTATHQPEKKKPAVEAPKPVDVPATVSSEVAPVVAEAAPPATNEPEKPAVANAEPSASDAPSESAPEAVDSNVTKVKIEVVPTDSTIALYGKVVTGPRVFEVKKGTRTILEVARPGYITRRIVLNGKKPFVRIMMTPLPKPKANTEGAPAGAVTPNTTAAPN